MNTPGERLRAARERSGWKSGRNAAVNFNWPVSSYGAHERAGEPGGRQFRLKDAERYAQAFKVSAAWLLTGEGPTDNFPDLRPPPTLLRTNFATHPDLRPTNAREAPEFSKRRLPVYGQAVGGFDGRFQFNGELVDTVPCPPGLENVPNAYAVYVAGESMEPRFRPGETVWVHPSRPPRKGDDVVVQMAPSEHGQPVEGFIKEFVAWTPTMLVLSQHNPKKEIELDRPTVISVHTIVGLLRT